MWLPVDSPTDREHWTAIALAILVPLFILFSVGMGALIAHRGLAPLDRIIAIASEIEAHDLTRRLNLVEQSAPRELVKLASTVDRMLDRIEAAFVREHRFTSDASHELRAPLAIIAAEVDLALRRDRTPESYRETLRTVADAVSELEQLVEALLAAARVSDAPRLVGVSSIVPKPACSPRSSSTDLEPLAAQSSTRVSVEIAPAAQAVAIGVGLRRRSSVRSRRSCTTPSSSRRAETSASGSTATRRTSSSRSTTTAPGFTEEGLPGMRVERFLACGSRSHARKRRGKLDLGLATRTAAIVHDMGGVITLASGASSGATVTMRLPVSDL